MAKGKAKTTNPTFRDVLPNRAYIRLAGKPATTTVSLTTLDTMMSARERAGWLISRVDVQPKSLQDGWTPTHCGWRCQVATGEQTALLDVDDDNTICTIDLLTIFTTSGAAMQFFPASWIGPVLVSSAKITAGMDCSDDVGQLQNVDFLVTIWYKWVSLGTQELLEMMQAKGVI